MKLRRKIAMVGLFLAVLIGSFISDSIFYREWNYDSILTNRLYRNMKIIFILLWG